MEGLLLESLAAEVDKERQRRVDRIPVRMRRSRRPRRPSGSWVLSGSIATWLGR